MKKIFIFVFLIFVCGAIFAGDFKVIEIIAPKVVIEDTNFDINVIVVNTFNTPKDINLRIQVFTPTAIQIFDRNYNSDDGNEISIGANDINNLLIPLSFTDTNASTAQHLIRATIFADDDNPINNVGQNWFVIKQAQKSIPIPDMPIYFGFIIAIITIVFLTNKKEKK